MGMNTVVHIKNDGFHIIEEDLKGFVQTIRIQMHIPLCEEFRDLQGRHGNIVTTMPYHHASDERYYISGGNTICEVSTAQADYYISKGFDDQYIKELDRLVEHAKYVKKYIKAAKSKKGVEGDA
jgi:hypothetical protein